MYVLPSPGKKPVAKLRTCVPTKKIIEITELRSRSLSKDASREAGNRVLIFGGTGHGRADLTTR